LSAANKKLPGPLGQEEEEEQRTKVLHTSGTRSKKYAIKEEKGQ